MTIYWKLAFTDTDDNNTTETALGFGETAKLAVNANLTLTQED